MRKLFITIFINLQIVCVCVFDAFDTMAFLVRTFSQQNDLLIRSAM